MANNNLISTTREAWERGKVDEVMYAMPLYAALLDQQKRSWVNGTALKKSVKMDHMDSLAQSYNITEPLTAGSKTIFDTLEFPWRRWQLPVEYTDEDNENTGGGENAPEPLVAGLLEAAKDGAIIKLNKMAYGLPATDPATSKKDFFSITDALNDGTTTYGGVARSTTSNTWLMGGSVDGTWTDQNANMTASLANFRKIETVCQQYTPGSKKSDFIALCGSTLFQAFQSQVEARQLYVREGSTPMASYGFNTLSIDGIELVEDTSLNLNLNSGTTSSEDFTAEWFFMLHKPDWELRFHPTRAMSLTDVTWDGERAGGLDLWLARIMAKGNLVCWKPRASVFRSYMTA